MRRVCNIVLWIMSLALAGFVFSMVVRRYLWMDPSSEIETALIQPLFSWTMALAFPLAVYDALGRAAQKGRSIGLTASLATAAVTAYLGASVLGMGAPNLATEQPVAVAGMGLTATAALTRFVTLSRVGRIREGDR